MPRTPELPVERVTAELRARLASSEWAPDAPLPPVSQLAAEHKTSRATVSRALRTLADEGLVKVVPRWGTFKARP